ncbi:MAG: POTRA domain-containing protein, partial [Myxococcota bacterium]|nr:POTRA domain-containing protein [Myxococcota bacterium]
MYWSLLAILLAGTPVPDKLSPYRGQTVVWVEIEAPAYEDVFELQRLVEIQPGYILSTADIHKAIKRLYSLGRFSNVQVYAKRLAGAVELTFELKPKLYIGYINITGLDSTSEQGLLKALSLGSNDEFDSRTEANLRKIAREHLKRIGYPNARVELTSEGSEEDQFVDFSLTIIPGQPNLVRSIEFSGSPRLAQAYLAAQLSTRLEMPLNQEILEQDRRTLEDLYLSRDFRQVDVGEPVTTTSAEGAHVTFPIRAGPRVSIEFTGNHQLSDNTLLTSWPDSRGRLSRGDLSVFERRISRQYRRIGYFNARITTRGFVDPTRQITRYLFSIDEGRPVTVENLRFPGARSFTQDQLEGHVYAVLFRALGTDGMAQPLQTQDADTIERGGSSSNNAKTIPTQKIRRKVIPQRDRWIPELYAEAIQEIRAAYQNLGYLKAVVGPAQIEMDDDQGTVKIPISEGAQSRVASVSFRNNLELSSLELLELIDEAAQLTPGAPLSASAVEDARIALIRAYRDRGYIYCRVFSSIIKNEDETKVQISYRFEEGLQVRIGEILVRGNRHTLDSFIRNRITLGPGDVYRLDQALEDQRNISSLGVFSRVQLRLIDEDTPAERKDLVADVTERKRHRVEVAGGLSTEDGPRVKLTYGHLNLFGVGANFVSSLKLNRQVFFSLYGEDAAAEILKRYSEFDGLEELTKGVEREVRLSITSPTFHQLLFDPVLRADIVNERDNLVSYFLDTMSSSFGTTLTPAPWFKIALEPQLSVVKLDCISDACEAELREINLNSAATNLLVAGERQGFKIGPVFSLDFRDNPLNPTRGLNVHVDAHFATGQSKTSEQTDFVQYKFSKVQAGITGYIPIGKTVLTLASSGGDINPLNEATQTPLDERFLVGGRDTLRGRPQNSVQPQGCPVDSCTGGLAYALFKSELRVPVSMGENLFIDFFFETGNLWYEVVDW